MKRTSVVSLAVAFLALSQSSTARADIISVDLDAFTPAIESIRTVPAGTTFTVAVLVTAGPSSKFDTALLELFFNDAGFVLSSSPTLLSGTLAKATTEDFFSSAPVPTAGIPLTVMPTTAPFPPFPHASGTGGAGLFDGSFFELPLGVTLSILTLDFTALAPGISTILPVGYPAPSEPPDPTKSPLILEGGEVPAVLIPGTVTVTMGPSAVIPEPSSIVLCSIGAIGLLARRCRSRRTDVHI